MATATATDVTWQLVEGVPARRWDELPLLYHPDAVVQPLAMPAPVELCGRKAIAEHFARAALLPLTMEAENVRIHATTDAELVVAEFDYRCRHTGTGLEFVVANAYLVRVRDGLIVHSRDYTDHARFAAAFGRLGDAAEAWRVRATAAGR